MSGLAAYSEKKGIDQNQVIEDHGPLVKRIAYHLMNRLPPSVQSDDLIQAGMIGLLEAARNYDATQGASFETYAGFESVVRCWTRFVVPTGPRDRFIARPEWSPK